MKKISILALGVCMLSTMAFVLNTDSAALKIGDKAPMMDAKMMTATNLPMTLNDVKKENGMLVVFSCNTCPFVIAWEDRYNDLYATAAKNNIGMVLINSNEAKRTGDDSQAEMMKHARTKGYKMPYLVDKDHKLADAFGARTTPHVYLFNKKGELSYVGAIDDNQADKSAVGNPYVTTAMEELGKGKLSCTTAETKAVGCSIKRVASAQ